MDEVKSEWIVLTVSQQTTESRESVLNPSHLPKGLMDGPFTTREVFDLISAGQVSYDDRVWKEGWERWMRIGDRPEFDRRLHRVATVATDLPTTDRVAELESLALAQEPKEKPFPFVLRPKIQQTQQEVFPVEAATEDLVGPLPWMKSFCLVIFFSAALVSALKPCTSRADTTSPAVVEFQVKDSGKTDGKPIQLVVTGKGEEILNSNGYKKTFDVTPNSDGRVVLNLESENLQPGTYTVTRMGESAVTKSIFVGSKNPEFEKELLAHAKQILTNRSEERRSLFYFAQELSAVLKEAEGAAGSSAKHQALDQRFASALARFQSFQEERSADLIFNSEFSDLRAVGDRVKAQLQKFRSVSGRSIANDANDVREAARQDDRAILEALTNFTARTVAITPDAPEN